MIDPETILDAIKSGADARELIERAIAESETDLRCEGIRIALDEMMMCSNPKLHAYQLAFAANLDCVLNLSGPEIAKKLHISKQAFHDGVEAIRVRLKLKYTRNMRSPEAREKMRVRNYRRRK